ncbi:hypothetical protein HanPI659440_Chr02g0036421 [Helianthus annuus]|nr:hypothetical protein HanPI659440_Chr02g0036421 [Helianthus annuus]
MTHDAPNPSPPNVASIGGSCLPPCVWSLKRNVQPLQHKVQLFDAGAGLLKES